jgi:two-component system, sensor histidine kinase and response regulator
MTKVLIIDDEISLRETVRTILHSKGYETLTASDGAAGIELARKNLPDLIICDVKMELVDGYQMLTVVRNDPMTATIPFILMTGQSDREALRHGMELGADDYLPKPFSPAELIAAVNARLEKHETLVRQAESKLEELREQMSMALPHELRTPLNGILGFADILRKQFQSLQPLEIAKMAERIYLNGKRLQRLVENYLIYAQMNLKNTDPKQLELFRISRTDKIDELIIELAHRKAQEFGRGADLVLELSTASVAISSQFFLKIVEEILDNAFRYSPKESEVCVSASRSGDSITIVVKDKGRGMTPEQIQKIGPYVQFERKTYEQQGSGLGLTVARRLAELHDGSFSIESVYGTGTSVNITLPQPPKT